MGVGLACIADPQSSEMTFLCVELNFLALQGCWNPSDIPVYDF